MPTGGSVQERTIRYFICCCCMRSTVLFTEDNLGAHAEQGDGDLGVEFHGHEQAERRMGRKAVKALLKLAKPHGGKMNVLTFFNAIFSTKEGTKTQK